MKRLTRVITDSRASADRMGKNFSGRGLLKNILTVFLLLSFCLIAVACGRTTSPAGSAADGKIAPTTELDEGGRAQPSGEDLTPYLGEAVYLAPLIALTWETDNEGFSGINHREVKDLEGLLTAAKQPILLSFYDELADHAHRLIPALEQLAADYRNKAHVILAQPTAEADILAYFDKGLLPVTYLIQDAEIEATHQDWSDEVLTAVKSDLDRLIGRAEPTVPPTSDKGD